MSVKRLFNHSVSIFIHGFFLNQIYYVQRSGLEEIEAAMIAFAMIWLIMSMVLFAFKIQCGFPFPEKLLRIRSCERSDVYEKLGIKLFRWLLIKGPFRFANQDVYLKGKRGIDALQILLSRIQEAELAHFVNVILALMAMLLYHRLVLWLFIWNIIFNVYPILLQRYHRLRIERIVAESSSQ